MATPKMTESIRKPEKRRQKLARATVVEVSEVFSGRPGVGATPPAVTRVGVPHVGVPHVAQKF
jgi:hypothetical protein